MYIDMVDRHSQCLLHLVPHRVCNTIGYRGDARAVFYDDMHIDIDLFTVRLDPASLSSVFDQEMLDGINRIEGKTLDGKPLTFIPYFLWGNRGPSQMTVWVNA